MSFKQNSASSRFQASYNFITGKFLSKNFLSSARVALFLMLSFTSRPRKIVVGFLSSQRQFSMKNILFDTPKLFTKTMSYFVFRELHFSFILTKVFQEFVTQSFQLENRRPNSWISIALFDWLLTKDHCSVNVLRIYILIMIGL